VRLHGYAICPVCSGVHPASAGCPDCGDRGANAPPAERGDFAPPSEPPPLGAALRARRIVANSRACLWLADHLGTVGLVLLTAITVAMIVLRAG
jgi:hypothetical protein